MKRVLVVGCGHGTPEAKKIIKELGHNDILFCEKREDIPIGEFEKQIITHNITARPLIELPFYPKDKHSPKGHERPYRFHK